MLTFLVFNWRAGAHEGIFLKFLSRNFEIMFSNWSPISSYTHKTSYPRGFNSGLCCNGTMKYITAGINWVEVLWASEMLLIILHLNIFHLLSHSLSCGHHRFLLGRFQWKLSLLTRIQVLRPRMLMFIPCPCIQPELVLYKYYPGLHSRLVLCTLQSKAE